MLELTTTITINGSDGERFLSSLARYDLPVPRALRWLASSEHRSIEVDRTDADQVAAFVDGLLDSGWISIAGPPLLFSPRVGDHVMIQREVLAEIGREAAGLPPTWACVPAGTRGKLLGWRDREDDSRAIVEVSGADRRVIVFVTAPHVTRVPAPPMHRRSHRSRHR